MAEPALVGQERQLQHRHQQEVDLWNSVCYLWVPGNLMINLKKARLIPLAGTL